jgi:XTP/dITP diphosphohydrolase
VTRPATPRRLVIASHNAGKVVEIRDLLASFGVEVTSAAELGLPEPEETGDTYIANAVLKAEAAAAGSGLAALADDSGLSVDALDGAPGLYSARWAGPSKDFGAGMARVQRELTARGATDFRASFVCALALAEPGQASRTWEGRVHGVLTFPPRGSRGFGYDPIFVADGESQTFGEMDPARKHAMSHRARAFAQLVADVFAEVPRSEDL